MYGIVRTRDFERSYRKLKHSGKLKVSVKNDLEDVITLLADGQRLPTEYRDHQLKGALSGYRECHIKGDLLLVYQQNAHKLVLLLVDLTSHSELFG